MTDQWGAGNRQKWDHWGLVRVGGSDLPLVWGEHPHSRQDNKMYVLDGDEPTAFDGHRVLIDVVLRSENYRKESHYSGDEIRKGGSGVILADGEQIYEFFFRDIGWALLRAHALIGELTEHSSNVTSKAGRAKLPGRKIYYRETPAVIERFLGDQGAVVIRTEDGKPFPPPVWRKDDDERESTIKDDILTRHIWWHRE